MAFLKIIFEMMFVVYIKGIWVKDLDIFRWFKNLVSFWV